MLSNAYFLAKFRFDTAENEPAKNLQNFRKMHFRKMHFRRPNVDLGRSARARYGVECSYAHDEQVSQHWKGRDLPVFGKISAKCCSFSAVSASIFASKYALFSICLDLQDYLTEFSKCWQFFADFDFFILLKFHENC